MNNHQKTDYISWIVLVGILLLVVEITFFNKGIIFSILFSAALIYFGIKRIYRSFGKLILLIGCITMFFIIINMMMFKFFILAIIAYVIIYFYKSKDRPLLIQPTVKEVVSESKIFTTKSFFKNVFIGKQQTADQIYEWHDVNIHVGIGDTRVDLSNTVLQKCENVILIRNFIGNIQVLVPYDVEVSVSHSVISGTTQIFESTNERLFNQTLSYRTENYDQSLQRMKIVTSIGIGRLEVKRI